MAINFGQGEVTVNLDAANSMVPGSADVLLTTSADMSIKVITQLKIQSPGFKRSSI